MRMYFAVVAFLCIVLADEPLEASNLRVVALSGDQMPGRPSGQVFEFFAPPLLNDVGQTAFFSGFPPPGPLGSQQYTGSSIWSEGSGALAPVAVRGGRAPGVSGDVAFNFFNQLGFNNAGKTVIRAHLVGDGINPRNDFATYLETSTGLGLVSRTGDPAPGIPGAVFGGLQTLLVNDEGEIAFRCNVGSPTFPNDDSIWHWQSGSLRLVAKVNDTVPGSTVTIQGLRDPVLNDNGQVAFFSQGTSAIWSGEPNSMRLIARSGDAAPGTANGETFANFLDPAINNSDRVAFPGVVSGTENRSGIWSDRSGALELVVRAGTAADGTPAGVVFSSLSQPVLNDAGRIAFRGQLIGNGVTDQSDSGIWADSAGSIQLVAREGDQPPGVSGNAAFAEFDRNSHVLNALGQIAFLGGLVGDGITAANDVGIWATAQNGALSLIAREGDELEVRPNEFRTISELRFLGGSGNGDSRPSGFNNVGQVAFYAQFSDGSSGVFVSDRVAIPEPTSLWLLAIAVGMLHAVKRQGNSAR